MECGINLLHNKTSMQLSSISDLTFMSIKLICSNSKVTQNLMLFCVS